MVLKTIRYTMESVKIKKKSYQINRFKLDMMVLKTVRYTMESVENKNYYQTVRTSNSSAHIFIKFCVISVKHIYNQI